MKEHMEHSLGTFLNILDDIKPKKTILFSHSDHDGFTSSVLFNLYFKKRFGKTAKITYPSKEMPYYKILSNVLRDKPKYLIIMDALVYRQKFIVEKICKNTVVVNMDHHNILNIDNDNYINLNPHQWGKEYLNSSGLVWLILRENMKAFFDSICWLPGIGAIQDYCFRDNKELFNEMKRRHYLKNTQIEELLDSEFMKMAKMINLGISNYGPGIIYEKIFQAGMENKPTVLSNNSRLLESYQTYEKDLAQTYKVFKERKIETDNLISFDFSGTNLRRISDIVEVDRQPKIYVGYSEGMLSFNSLFCDYNIRKLAGLFGGGGAHSKVGGARTQNSFIEVVRICNSYLKQEKEQKSLDSFF